jgi:hypothetical protein
VPLLPNENLRFIGRRVSKPNFMSDLTNPIQSYGRILLKCTIFQTIGCSLTYYRQHYAYDRRAILPPRRPRGKIRSWRR